MTQLERRRSEATYTFVRVIAFANLDLQSPNAQWETQTHVDGDVRTPVRVSRHCDLPDEIGRALRLPPAGRAAKAIAGPPRLRPLAFLAREDPVERQRHMQSLLIDIIASNHHAVAAALGCVPVEARSRVIVAGSEWRPTPKWRHRLQLDVSYIAPLGYDALRYAVVLAGEHRLYHRLARCLMCQRFILGNTDKPIRYCADDDCKPSGSRAAGRAASIATEYKRRERERQQRWDEHRSRIRAALTRSTTPRQLARLIRQGIKLVDECFQRSTSQARKDAQLILGQAEDRLKELRKAPGATRRPSRRDASTHDR